MMRSVDAVSRLLATVVLVALQALSVSAEVPAVGVLLSSAQTAESRELDRGVRVALAELSGERPTISLGAGRKGWETVAGDLTALVYEQGVELVVGPVDGRSSHLVAQICARAKGRFRLVLPWASDPSLSRAGVRHMVTLMHDDRQQAEALLDYAQWAGLHKLVVVASEADYDSRIAKSELVRAIRPGQSLRAIAAGEPAAVVEGIIALGADAVVLLLSPAEAGVLCRHLHRQVPELALLGPARLALDAFFEAAAGAAEGMVLAAPSMPTGTNAERFASAYRRSYGVEPMLPAWLGHDAVRLLVDWDSSSEKAALPTATIEGLSGHLTFDQAGYRQGPSPLSVVRGGRLDPVEQQVFRYSKTQDQEDSLNDTIAR